ncbi:MAG: DUF1592 domain-containing protein [Gemmataceae bacterium]
MVRLSRIPEAGISRNREVFKTFDDGLRQAMFEEPTRLATHLLQKDEPITEMLASDRTFVNKKLADIMDSRRRRGASGTRSMGYINRAVPAVLGMAVFLTKNSQPQRTSPVGGFWVVRQIARRTHSAAPRRAALPAKETDTKGKTIRQLLARRTDDARCTVSHVRFDPVASRWKASIRSAERGRRISRVARSTI